MRFTLQHETRLKYEVISKMPVFSKLETSSKQALFNASNLLDNAVTLQNVNEHTVGLVYLMYTLNLKKYNKLRVLDRIEKNETKKLKLGNLITNPNWKGLYLPRARCRAELYKGVSHPEDYSKIIEEDLNILKYENWVHAMNTLSYYNVIDLNIGHPVYDPDNAITELLITEATIKPITEWKDKFIKLLPQNCWIDLFSEFSDKPKKIKTEKVYTGLTARDSTLATYENRVEVSKVKINSHKANEINNWNCRFPLTENVYTKHTKFKVNKKIYEARFYNKFTALPKPSKAKLLNLIGYQEYDQSSSIQNALRYAETNTFFKTHPNKQFLSLLLSNSKMDDEMKAFFIQNVLYTANKDDLSCKQLSIMACNLDYKNWISKVRSSLVNMGLTISADFYNTLFEPCTSNKYQIRSNQIKENLTSTFEKYIKSRDNYVSNKKMYDKLIAFNKVSPLKIKVETFVSVFKTYFSSIENYLFNQNWYINQSIDCYWTMSLLKVCKEYNLPLLMCHDAVYLPKLDIDIDKLVSDKLIEAVDKYKSTVCNTHEYNRLLVASYKFISKSDINKYSKDSTNIKSYLTKTYESKIENMNKFITKYKVSSDIFYTKDIYFNKLIDNTITLSEILNSEFETLMYLYMYYKNLEYSNIIITDLNFDKFCKLFSEFKKFKSYKNNNVKVINTIKFYNKKVINKVKSKLPINPPSFRKVYGRLLYKVNILNSS